MSKISTLTLKKGQYLSNLSLPVQKNKFTLIQAGTGVGKTTTIMEDYPKQHPIIVMLVPSVLKVKELETTYGDVSGSIQYRFYYDKKSPTEDELSQQNGLVVVATYDKMEAIVSKLSIAQRKSTLLVVDECHKLYAAGSYRDDAINSIIFRINHKKGFRTVLFLTATFTDHCWETLKLPLDYIYKVDLEEVGLKRSLEMLLIDKGNQFSFIPFVIERLKKMQEQGTRKKIIIRLNHRTKCERVAALLERFHNAHTLTIHSKNKDTTEVQNFFTAQKIPSDVDVVFCTSIMDEAVNINNLNDELDSVFVIGTDAHPEELVQFLGRLRKTAVPCFMVNHTGIELNHIVDMHALKQKKLEKNERFINRLTEIANLLSELMDDYDLDIEEVGEEVKSIYKRVTYLNETFNELSGAKLFAVHCGKAVHNIASIAANYYRMDKSNCYSNFYLFKERVTELLPTCTVKHRIINDCTLPSYIKEFLDEEKKASDDAYKASIVPAFEIFLEAKKISYVEIDLEAEFDDISPIIAQKAEVAGQSTDNTSQDKEVTDNVSEKSDEKTQVEENAKQPEKENKPAKSGIAALKQQGIIPNNKMDDDQKANEKHKKEPPTSFQKLKEKLKKEKMRSSTVPCPIEKDANDHSDNERTMLIKNEAVKVHNANAETEDVFDEEEENTQVTANVIEDLNEDDDGANKSVTEASCNENDVAEDFTNTSNHEDDAVNDTTQESNHGDDIANNVTDESSHESKVTDVINEESSHENDLTDNVTEKSSNEDEEADEATEETKANSTQDNLLRLRDVGTSVLNQHEEDEQFIEQLVAQYDVPSHATTVEILLQIAQLSKVIGNLNDIHAIIEKKQFNTVMSVARAYKSNIVVHYFIKRFYRYNPERYLDNGFQLTPDDAADWLLKGFKQVQKDTAIPFKRVLKDKLVSGIKVDPKTKEVSINPSKAANFFAKHFSVNDRNAKKPASRYLEFTGIAYGNYQFLAIAKYQQPFLELPNEFKLGERTFNPFTGAVISGPDSPLEMIIHSDQPDYFDEGEIENKGEGLGQVA
ncbi:DEAD/DEAH box helicase family protein [Acinetobacter pittii]|uniref:DEAD/DEAH box helicase family protein n=2 Tax=Acinetobacter pittii TaxID=48296 RepID=UPI001022E9AA|nr:DEAD/DEAH box helicase family protein [Acinetobacter pittii]RZH09657.1 DEAD/DEAH box helicase [Acinetobacter pittii]